MVTSFPDADNFDILRDRVDKNTFNVEKASEWSEQQKQDIENTFMRLHPVLISNDDPPFHPDPTAIPTKEGVHRVGNEGRSTLRRCLFALSYGEPLDKVGQKEKIQGVWSSSQSGGLLYFGPMPQSSEQHFGICGCVIVRKSKTHTRTKQENETFLRKVN